jgi:predicted TIM-barrel fold metal-dependent hydrolase
MLQQKTDNMKGSFYEELERVFDKFPKYHMKILLGHFNAKVGREDILNRQLKMKVYIKLVVIMELA